MARIVHIGITRSRHIPPKKTDPSPAQADLLKKLGRPRTTRELAALLDRSQNSVRASLAELRSKGLVAGPDGDFLWRRT